jgi:hypothetical protein
MQTGTALGLLVGGAVLLLAVAPPRAATVNAAGQPMPAAPAPGGMLNPLNWFGGGGGSLGSQIFGQPQQPAQLPPGGYYPAQTPAAQSPRFSNAGYSPYGGPGAYSPAAYQSPAAQSPSNWGGAGYGTAANFQYPVMTPMGGFQSMAYMSPANTGGMSPANYTAYDSPQTPIYNYA